MKIKEHYLYPMYLQYLEEKDLSRGAFCLYKISEEAFFDFKYKYDTDNLFREYRDNIQKSIIRENKIVSILDDKNNRTDESR